MDVSQIEGTVGAAVPPNEAQSYDRGSRAFINDVPFGRGQPHGAEVVPGIRASLITELREISGQVNRMMSQVDRAIHRLGEHAGAPLKR